MASKMPVVLIGLTKLHRWNLKFYDAMLMYDWTSLFIVALGGFQVRPRSRLKIDD
jgi:hypothetical protein